MPEWQGPNSVRMIARTNAWLTEQDLERVAELTLPDFLIDQVEEAQTLDDLYECKAFRLAGEEGQIAGQRRGPNGGGRPDGAERPNFDGSTSNRPTLNRQQRQALCPASTQVVAKAVPAQLITYVGDLALIRPVDGYALENEIAVTQAFDRLANGTWLILPEGEDAQ